VTRTTIDINDEVLERAARELGTANKVDTVNAALTFVAERRKLAAAMEDPLMWGSPDLADSSVRAAARR
jgi:Arc/MetJ family transcription regulator